MPLSGSNLLTARMRPTLPSWTRSRTFCIQRRWKSMAMRTTRRRCDETSLFLGLEHGEAAHLAQVKLQTVPAAGGRQTGHGRRREAGFVMAAFGKQHGAVVAHIQNLALVEAVLIEFFQRVQRAVFVCGIQDFHVRHRRGRRVIGDILVVFLHYFPQGADDIPDVGVAPCYSFDLSFSMIFSSKSLAAALQPAL